MTEPELNEAAVFDEARKLSDPQQRGVLLAAACRGDAALRRRVEELLSLQAEADAHYEETARQAPRAILNALASGVAAPLLATERVGDRIGRYKLLQKLGEGGCGVVYMAGQEESLRRHVALKVIKLGMDTREVIARFEAERQALALMDHPHIAKVLDAGTTEAGRPYFVMELVRGVKLTEFCDQQQMPTVERLKLFAQVCRAVQHAHQKGIIHRDLKPSNVLVTLHDGVPVPKVIDFGIAKATTGQRLTDKTFFTAFEQFLGTPAYMSPEQAEMSGLDIDTRSDIYSLGVLLYELLTGRTPFDARELLRAGFDEMRRTIREQEPARPSTRLSTLLAADLTAVATHRQTAAPKLVNLLRGDLDWIVMKCLEKDRSRRYETANDLAADLQRHLANEPVVARPPTAAYRTRKFVGKHRRSVAAAAAFVILLVGAAVASTLLALRANTQRAAAVQARTEADVQRNRVLTALAAEAASRRDTETQRDRAVLAEQQATAIQQFLLSHVIDAARPNREVGGLGRDVTVRAALDAAEPAIASSFGRQPRVEVAIREALGTSYLHLGDPAKAITQFEKVRALRARLPSEPKLELVSRTSLATAYLTAGRRPDYVQTLEESWQWATNAFGIDALETLSLQGSLGVAYRDVQRPKDALRTLTQGLQHAERARGPEHPETLNLLNALSVTYHVQGDRAAAIPLMERILEIRQRTLGPDDNETTRIMVDLARAYHAAGRWTNAQPLFQTAYDVRRRVNGADSGTTLIAHESFAAALEQVGQLTEAESLWRESLRLRETKYGLDHPASLMPLQSLARLLMRTGRTGEAEKIHRRIHEDARTKYGLAHPETVRTLSVLRNTLTRMERTNEARSLLDEVAAGLSDSKLPDAAVRADILQRLSRVFTQADRPEEAGEISLRAQVAARQATNKSPFSVKPPPSP